MSTGYTQIPYPAGHPNNYETQVAEYEKQMAEYEKQMAAMAAGTLVPHYEGYEPYKPSRYSTTYAIPTPNKNGTASSRDVVGRFLERKASAPNRSYYTDGRAIYSYGSHWRMAYYDDAGDGSIKWDVNMWRKPYSSMTSGHMSDVERDPRLWGKVSNIDIFPEKLKEELAEAIVAAAMALSNMGDFHSRLYNVACHPKEEVVRECFERARAKMAAKFADDLRAAKSGAAKKRYTKQSVAAWLLFLDTHADFYLNLLGEYEKRYFKAYGEKMPPIPIRTAPVAPPLVTKEAHRLGPKVLTEKKAILAWHFLSSDKKLRFGDNRAVVVGETLSVNKTPEMCAVGLHGSRQMKQAFGYYNGMVVCRVAIFGCVEEIADKVDGQHRACLGMVEVSEIARAMVERGMAQGYDTFSNLIHLDPKGCEAVALELMGLDAKSRQPATKEEVS